MAFGDSHSNVSKRGWLARTEATTKPDPDSTPRTLMWGAMTKEPRVPKTTARTRRGEPDGTVYDGTKTFW